MQLSLRALALAAILAVTVGCSDDDDPSGPGPGSNTVTMGATTFSPTTLTVARNSVVTWSNTSGVLHNVTFTTAGSPANIGDHSSGSTTRSFSTAGTFSYNCTNHAGMNGAIVVQ